MLKLYGSRDLRQGVQVVGWRGRLLALEAGGGGWWREFMAEHLWRPALVGELGGMMEGEQVLNPRHPVTKGVGA